MIDVPNERMGIADETAEDVRGEYRVFEWLIIETLVAERKNLVIVEC
jgi:hypothetical protein